ncbi:LssY C-terminal domain-containing protein [Arthrobacter sp. MDT2-16]|uniref:LssY C-terminal domain-containing protein n=1 Tax=Arthrobacter ruber TaxID=1258893 RepID=UPI000CF5076E|nr:LssY C-terminal domain-containing protein [Arthrobacter ruber]
MNEAPRARRGGTGRGSGHLASTVVLLAQRLFFLLAVVLSGWAIYALFLEEVDDGVRQPWVFVIIWALAAYVLVPRINRLLTRVYVPDYFIGRTRTADGLLGDPVNLAVIGTVPDLRAAMLSAGWIEADPLTLRTSLRIITASVLRRSYPSAPVSPLFVFGRKQDLAFEQEVAGTPWQRHHVRFWTCPPGWILPGGFDVDLVGAATFDRSVGLSLFTFQVTHRVAARTDDERDWVVTSLRSRADVRTIRHFSSGYHSRNGGGDAIETDGDLPILTLTPQGVPDGAPDGSD